MKRAVVVFLVAALVMAPWALPAGADTGMEGVWTGRDADGEIMLMLGTGGTFISAYKTDLAYRQAGLYSVDNEYMYLSVSDGSDLTLRYGFSEGYLYLSADDSSEEVALQRVAYEPTEGLAGVWVVSGTDAGGDGLIGMDNDGNFFSADAATGELSAGIYQIDDGEILIAFQDGSASQMGFAMENGQAVLTNPDTGEELVLAKYEAGEKPLE